ncbi:hypothetical protein ACFE04_013626 [Oxalis oulophora]
MATVTGIQGHPLEVTDIVHNTYLLEKRPIFRCCHDPGVVTKGSIIHESEDLLLGTRVSDNFVQLRLFYLYCSKTMKKGTYSFISLRQRMHTTSLQAPVKCQLLITLLSTAASSTRAA